jgi:hypothetical protein
MGTVCGSNVCANGPANVGQWTTPQYYGRACDGVTAGPGGCKNGVNMGCGGNLACASASACNSSCAKDADCLSGFYCNSGVCAARKARGVACTRPFECASLECLNNVCEDCFSDNGYRCPINQPFCQAIGGRWQCTACSGSNCLSDGSGRLNCRANSTFPGVCPANAPNCGTDGVCRCGTSATPCKIGQICVNGVCKIGGTLPCVQSTDCATGTCGPGVCPATPQNNLCIEMFPFNPCDQTGADPNFPPGCFSHFDVAPICQIDTSKP